MSAWPHILIPYFKFIHIAALAIWAAGLFALPLMLTRHDPTNAQADYTRLRQASHYSYTLLVTPMAVLAIISGTVLIFLREVFVTWMFAKLVFVALMVVFHAWVGHVLVSVAETEGEHTPPSPTFPVLILLGIVICVLALVLAKPDLGAIPMPEWLVEPRELQLPFDVPRR